MKTYSVGDRVILVTSRTSGAKSYTVKITKVLNKNTVKGIVLSGDFAGMTVTGTPQEFMEARVPYIRYFLEDTQK